MLSRKLTTATLLLVLIHSVSGQQQQRYVLLPASEVAQLGVQGSWQPTKADIEGLEASLRHISDLQARGWKPVQHVEHPEQYFRQYLGVSAGGMRRIFVNAFCDVSSSPDWRSRLVLTADGGSCYWHVTYDPATKKFSGLEINGRG